MKTSVLDDQFVKIRKISPEDDKQYFFGYYDITAFHSSGNFHLCNRVSFMDRLPIKGDVCELGILDLRTSKFFKISETRAWNFQQGAMFQWNTANEDEVIYNDCIDGGYRGVVKNIHSGKERILERPVANVSPDGRWGLSINMSRVYDFRPGYGYCNMEDPWKNVDTPERDGVFLVDMESGEAKQIITYEQLGEMYNKDLSADRKRKIVINHITFNQESERFLFLVRCFPDEHGWLTGLGTSDLNGNIYKLRSYTYASHYYWGKQGNLMLYGDCGEGDGLYVMSDESQDYTIYDKKLFCQDIHCSYSPDGEWIIGDGYQDAEMYRPVYLYNVRSGKGMIVARFYSPRLAYDDIRCDLHSRWSPDGKHVSFDSIHEGMRGVYMMELTDAMAMLL